MIINDVVNCRPIVYYIVRIRYNNILSYKTLVIRRVLQLCVVIIHPHAETQIRVLFIGRYRLRLLFPFSIFRPDFQYSNRERQKSQRTVVMVNVWKSQRLRASRRGILSTANDCWPVRDRRAYKS